MLEIYAFLFCLGLGLAARLLYIGATALARRTNLLPVTILLDFLVAALVGGGFTVYVILTSTVLAPYMFAALFAGYLFTYWITKGTGTKKSKKQKTKSEKVGE